MSIDRTKFDLPPEELILAELEAGYACILGAAHMGAFMLGAANPDKSPYDPLNRASKGFARAWNLGRDWRIRHGFHDSTYVDVNNKLEVSQC